MLQQHQVYQSKIKEQDRHLTFLKNCCDQYRQLLRTNNIPLPQSDIFSLSTVDAIAAPLSLQHDEEKLNSIRNHIPAYTAITSTSRSPYFEIPQGSSTTFSSSLSSSSYSPPIYSSLPPPPAAIIPASITPVATITAVNTTIIIPSTSSDIYGYCSLCEGAVQVRVSCRCNRCHSEDIMTPLTNGINAVDNNWSELNGHYIDCVHNLKGRCENKRWEFMGKCEKHPNKQPDSHCPLLPGVVTNINKLQCDGCKCISPKILRFDCGHFICLPKCWRTYACTKLDNRELLFDTPKNGDDATLRCPGNFLFI